MGTPTQMMYTQKQGGNLVETTERIVEAYVTYVKGWFTIPNIKCQGQFEVDLLAVDAGLGNGIGRYHIESGVSISGAYSRLTNKPFSKEALKERVKQAGQRRTLGYFTERKFGAPQVVQKLKEYGFTPGNYSKVIVSWGWDANVPSTAQEMGVKLWDFQDILRQIVKMARVGRTYFTDDTMRTLQLIAKATEQER